MDTQIVKSENPSDILASIMEAVIGEMVAFHNGNELANEYGIWLNIDSIDNGIVHYHLRSGADCPGYIKFGVDDFANAQEYVPLYVLFVISDGVKMELDKKSVEPEKVWYQLHVASSNGAINEKEIEKNIKMFHHFNK